MFHRVARVDVPAERVDGLIDDAVEFFREKEYDCLFTLSPLDRPADMAERLRQRGFELALLPVAMLCDQPAGPVSAEDVEVEIVGAGGYDTWAEIMCTCFGNPPEAGEAGRSVLDVPEVLLYLALRKGEPAGTALLYPRNGIGYIDAVGTCRSTAVAASPPQWPRAPSPIPRPWATAGRPSRSNAKAPPRGSTGASASAACISGRATPRLWRTFSEMLQGTVGSGRSGEMTWPRFR